MKYLQGTVDETLDAMTDDVIVGPVTHRLFPRGYHPRESYVVRVIGSDKSGQAVAGGFFHRRRKEAIETRQEVLEGIRDRPRLTAHECDDESEVRAFYNEMFEDQRLH